MEIFTIREINLYLKKNIKLPLTINKNEIKPFLLDKYSNQLWNKAGCKIHYNFYVINKLLGFDIKYIYDKNSFIVIDNNKIPIRLQDYFHYLFVNKAKEYELTSSWFDEHEFLDEDIINIEQRISCCNNKIYRTDMEIQVCPNHYICIEFFENNHKNFDDLDLQKEKNRIYNLLHDNNNDKKYLHFAIFWQNKLNDERYFKKFVISILKKIRDYKNINNKRIWCINEISSYIKHDVLAEQLYDAYKNPNNPIFKLYDLGKRLEIQWKNKKYQTKYFLEFKELIDEMQSLNSSKVEINDDELDFLNLDDQDNNNNNNNKNIYYVDDILTYNGFMIYINMIPAEYLKNKFEDKCNLILLFKRITDGFIDGTEKRYTLLNNINDQLIYGLYDYK